MKKKGLSEWTKKKKKKIERECSKLEAPEILKYQNSRRTRDDNDDNFG